MAETTTTPTPRTLAHSIPTPTLRTLAHSIPIPIPIPQTPPQLTMPKLQTFPLLTPPTPPQLTMPKLQTFPLLTPPEFDQACNALHQRLSTIPLKTTLTHAHGSTILEITKPTRPPQPPSPPSPSSGISDDNDNDPEALPPHPSPQTIHYHILLSPTYKVPVLYLQPSFPASLADIYDLLVPPSSRESVERVGVLGGISQGDHPLLGLPWYFVHPCNTAEAMREWEREEVDAERYLRVWLGLVGGVVGLFLPG